MLLAIDVGNTNVVFGVFQEGTLKAFWRIGTQHRRSSDEYGIDCLNLLKYHDIPEDKINQIMICSVVPPLDTTFNGMCLKYFGQDPVFIDGTNQGLLKIEYSPPSDVGADRVVNAISAYVRHGAPLIILDFGTATTFDVVDEGGVYLGGSIVPGINLSAEALYGKTARLPKVAISKPLNIIGKSTVESIQSGLYYGNLSMIKGVIDAINKELGKSTKVIVTGGLMDVFKNDMPWVEAFEPTLTLDGLSYIYMHRKDDKA